MHLRYCGARGEDMPKSVLTRRRFVRTAALGSVSGLLLAACAGPSTNSPQPAATSASPTALSPTDAPSTATEPAPAKTPSTATEVAPAETPLATAASAATAAPASATYTTEEFDVPSYAHDVAPDPADPNTVWWTAQGAGELGRFDPSTGQSKQVPLGQNSSPHGVIIGPDGNAWVTDTGQNAIARVDAKTEEVTLFPLSADVPNINMNTCAFDNNGVLWFTGQNGYYGRVNPQSGEVESWQAPRGRGPYGIDATPQGRVFYASLAGSHIAEINVDTGEATPIDPPTQGQGARRVWSDSAGNIWVSEWTAGQVGKYDPATNAWREWKLPGDRPQAYAVYVDERDIVWLSDFGGDALWAFEPTTEQFAQVPHSPGGNVRQILGRKGEVWGAESGVNKLIVVRVG